MTYEEQAVKVKEINAALLKHDIDMGEYSQRRWQYEFEQTEDYKAGLSIIVSWYMNKYSVSLSSGMSRLVDPISRSLEEITDINAFAQEVVDTVMELQSRVHQLIKAFK